MTTQKYKVLPQRNQFGMLVIVDDNYDVVKGVKSAEAANLWINRKLNEGEKV